jgi:CheY-like chemotaxis protein
VPRRFTGDPVRLKQILINLVSNAIKFTDSGHVTLRIGLVGQNETGSLLEFSVQDTGIGIPDEKITSIFEEFTQVDNTVTRRFGGTGLGLAITRQLVELMDGEMTVESSPGVGSTFTCRIELPPDNSDSGSGVGSPVIQEDAVPADQAEQSKIHALVAEDNVVNQLVALEMLRNLGCCVELAVNGHQAVAMAGERRYDLIFMDCQMPEMDGFEATTKIRKQERESEDPAVIVAMTAHAMKGDRERCLEAGMNDYVAKPVSQEKLREVVAKYCIPPTP